LNNFNSITIHDRGANTYDSQVVEYESHMHEALFGMCYDYIKKGDSLLDLGIGTGLSSIYFAREGLDIHGMDGSSEMLNECNKKDFVKELKQHSITDTPLPYKGNSFHHILCCGVFHFIGDISSITEEVSRILKKGGMYAFTVISELAKDMRFGHSELSGFFEIPNNWEIPVYKHSRKYIYKISNSNSFTIKKEQQILAYSGDENIGDMVFMIYILKKDK